MTSTFQADIKTYLASMRVGDALHVNTTDGTITLHDRLQPVQVKRARKGRNGPSKLGTRPYSVSEIQQLHDSDTRVLSLCPHCGHGESVEAAQMHALCTEYRNRKVVFAFGCNRCEAKENGLLLWTGLAALQDINEGLMKRYPNRRLNQPQ